LLFFYDILIWWLEKGKREEGKLLVTWLKKKANFFIRKWNYLPSAYNDHMRPRINQAIWKWKVFWNTWSFSKEYKYRRKLALIAIRAALKLEGKHFLSHRETSWVFDFLEMLPNIDFSDEDMCHIIRRMEDERLIRRLAGKRQ